MDDKTRNEITESISDAVSDTIAAQLRNHENKFNLNDEVKCGGYYGVINDGIIEFEFTIKAKKTR